MSTSATGVETKGRLWRSRWAAIGAAVAVSAGAGGLAWTYAASPASSLVAITPVRVLDTRLAAMGPAFTSETPRLLDVTGTIPTVQADGVTVANALVVPDGATAIVANVTVVSPTAGGFVSVRPGSATGTPTTSNLNFAAGAIVPNSVTVEVPTAGAGAGNVQIFYKGTPGSTSHILVDIVGYYLAGSGPAGPAGPAGATGAAGPRGFSAWDTIPSGQTVTGEITWSAAVTSTINAYYISVSLPALAPSDLANTTVNFAVDGFTTADDDATCTGTVNAPTAPAGKVCIYASSLGNTATMSGTANTNLKRHGFYVSMQPTSANSTALLVATWAYTAP
jgi:hypothetical protein